MSIVVVDYGVGNLCSVANAIKAAGGEGKISRQADDLLSAHGVILPGVGSFDYTLDRIDEFGLLEPLRHMALVRRIPVLGICLGMQLMAEASDEGQRQGFGWLGGRIIRFPSGFPEKLPHIGWNEIACLADHPLAAGLDGAAFYFLHSYHAEPSSLSVAQASYGGHVFPALLACGNLMGAQFHPEKSGDAGRRLFSNFLGMVHSHV